MKSIDGRLNKLERRFGIAGNERKYLLILTDRDIGEAEQDAYVQILGDGGFLPSAGDNCLARHRKSRFSKGGSFVIAEGNCASSHSCVARRISGGPYRVYEQRPQRYGTQWRDDPRDGRTRPWPIEEPEQVDSRRASVGLGPLRPIPELRPELSADEQQTRRERISGGGRSGLSAEDGILRPRRSPVNDKPSRLLL